MSIAHVPPVHADENAITAFVGGALSAAEMSRFRDHLDNCPDCLELVVVMVHDRPTVASTMRVDRAGGQPLRPPDHPVGTPSGPPDLANSSLRPSHRNLRVLAPGASVGPYAIERLIGAGGMGVVYAARDPRLDRTVALKLIRQEHGPREELGERLRRESKALARLSHPNVTVIYELGAADGEVYVAMEYVAGTNLRAWRHDKRPSVREILAIFRRAGRGLAAAHAAGLVHRDFKPDNVLIAADGAVKVTDFGLARLANEVLVDEPSLAQGAAVHELTMTGAVVGTPAYMAPEQFATAPIDARVDQFAFCVALYEALYGERPFRGETLDTLRSSIRAGRVEAPRTTRVPLRVRRALLRGLSADPDKRFASMTELLAAIAPRRGRMTLAALGFGLPATVALGAALFAQPAKEPCGGAAGEVALVWNPARRAAVRDAFVATRAPGALQAWSASERSIDGYVRGWVGMHGSACKATRVHRQQSEAALDLRMACLEHRRSQLDALLSVLGHADKDIVQHAAEAVAGLDDLDACADVEALGRRAPLPRDWAARRRYDELRARYDRAHALLYVTHYKDALATVTALEPQTTEFPVLEAQTLWLHGRILTSADEHEDGEPVLFRALVRAQAARADETVALAAADLANTVGYRAEQTEEGLRWADFAAAAITGMGGNELLAIRLESTRAAILDRAGRLAEGEQAHRKALAAARARHSPVVESDVLDGLAANLTFQGKYDEALQSFERALASRIEHYGELHALTASTRANLANVLSALRRREEAQTQYEKALATFEVLLGPDSLAVARVQSNLGQMLQEWGKYADARVVLERALAIREKGLGPDDPSATRTLANLGYLALAERRPQRALEYFAQADESTVRVLGADHIARADLLQGTGDAYIKLARPAQALAPLERAIALSDDPGADPVVLASMRARLAAALWLSGRDRVRAKQLAGAARKILLDAGDDKEVAELDAALKR